MSDDPVRVEDAGALYDAPVAAFVAARDDLVRRLRADGHTEDAAAVKALRRPTLAAWAVNQVIRHDPETWDRLTTAGEQARRAQRRALSGVADSGLRDAVTARRAAIEKALGAATRHLADAGARPEGHLDDVAATFEAASTDPELAEEVGAGRLAAPVRASGGLGDLTALLAVPATDVDAEIESADDPDAQRRRDAIRALEAARARADTRARAARQARAEAESLAAQAEDARDRARTAREAAERAEEDAVTAADRATAAAEIADGAASDADEAGEAEAVARQALDDLA